MHRFLRRQTSEKKKSVYDFCRPENFVSARNIVCALKTRIKFQKLFPQRCVLVFENFTRNLKLKMRITFKQTPTSTRSRLTAMSVWSRLVLSVPRRTVCRTAQIFWCSWSNAFCLLIARLLPSIDAESFFLNCTQRSSSCVTCSFISWNSFWDVPLSLSSTLLFKNSSLWCESSRSCKSSYTRWIKISVWKFCRPIRLDKICLELIVLAERA